MKIRILGLDPGSRVTGFGVVEAQGDSVVSIAHGALDLFRENPSFEKRLLVLGQQLRQILELHRPQHVVIEKIFLGRNADSAFKIGHARGVAVYEASLQGCEIFEYATREVKKGVTGRGSAEKTEVMAVISALLKIPAVKTLDASDALALAFHHSRKWQQQRLWQRAVEI